MTILDTIREVEEELEQFELVITKDEDDILKRIRNARDKRKAEDAYDRAMKGIE